MPVGARLLSSDGSGRAQGLPLLGVQPSGREPGPSLTSSEICGNRLRVGFLI